VIISNHYWLGATKYKFSLKNLGYLSLVTSVAPSAILLFIYPKNKVLDKYTAYAAFFAHSDLKSMLWTAQQFLRKSRVGILDFGLKIEFKITSLLPLIREHPTFHGAYAYQVCVRIPEEE
jgi:hypothetical protein